LGVGEIYTVASCFGSSNGSEMMSALGVGVGWHAAINPTTNITTIGLKMAIQRLNLILELTVRRIQPNCSSWMIVEGIRRRDQHSVQRQPVSISAT
jgi:hypothetical protein